MSRYIEKGTPEGSPFFCLREATLEKCRHSAYIEPRPEGLRSMVTRYGHNHRNVKSIKVQ